MLSLLETRAATCSRCLQLKQLQAVLTSDSSGRAPLSTSSARKSNAARTYYEVLGIKPDANAVDIKKAFVKISKEIHPDKNPENPKLHDQFVKLNEAYMVLNKPLTRKEYDMTLATRISQHQRMTHNMHGSHTPDSSHRPGTDGPQSATYEDEAERVFWDETIWYMRDRSKDYNAFYEEDSYYGVKGVKRVSNGAIIGGCFLVIGISMAGFAANMQYGKSKHVEAMKVDAVNVAHLQDARLKARQRGNQKQLEILNARMRERAESVQRKMWDHKN
ncbi:DnaJ-like subfamily C member 4 [Lamellibrachia satsuma]|nr:DnaJ-like subfamily C member 4 [Lamellibrachia satsuma]